MKTNPKVTPAYLVYHNTHTAEPTRTFFAHQNLLTARRAAMTFAESLFGSQTIFAPEDEVEVYLVETRSVNDPAPVTIARVLLKRIFPENPLLGNSIAPESEAAHLNREHYKQILLELQREMAYYQTNSLPTGFGSFGIGVHLEHEPFPINHVTVLFDAMGYAMLAVGNYNGDREHESTLTYNDPDEPVKLTAHS